MSTKDTLSSSKSVKDFIRFIPAEEIVAYLDTCPGAKRSDIAENVAELTNRDPSTLWRYLDHLKKTNVIRSEGTLKGTRYYLNVPRQALAMIHKAVADIVRDGHTHALESLGAHRGYAYPAVERALAELSYDTIGKYGLRAVELDDYMDRLEQQRRVWQLPANDESVHEAPLQAAG